MGSKTSRLTEHLPLLVNLPPLKTLLWKNQPLSPRPTPRRSCIGAYVLRRRKYAARALLEGRRRARRTILAPPCASRPAAPPCRRVRAAVAQTPPSERAPPHCAHTARGEGRDACCDGAWRRSPASVAPLIYQPPPVRRSAPAPPFKPRYGPCRARRRTGLCDVHTLAAAPSKRAPRKSRNLVRGGTRGGAGRGDVSYARPAPLVRPPTARASTHERIFASSSQPIPKYATLRELSACGRRYPRRPGRVEPRFVAPGHPTVINRCPAKICPISPSQFLASTRGVARLRAGACIEVRGRSAPGARVVGVGRARLAARRVSQGTNTRPRPPAPPRGPNSHPPPRRATHVQRAHAG